MNNPTPDSADPESPESSPEPAKKPSGHLRHLHQAKAWYASHKKWSIPATILILLIVVAGIPWTRYNLASLFIKKDFKIHITDSTAHTPVSGAVVSLGATTATTNGSGQATLHGVKPGPHNFTVNKKYYQAKTIGATVSIFSQKTTPGINMVATGRQVIVSVTDLITKKPLANVSLEVADTTAKTDSSGNALLVLPAGVNSQKIALSLENYNGASGTLQISNSTIKQNNLTLTPSGKVYYLSNSTGSLNIMKANLDGTDPQVAVAGTGSEQAGDSALIESADGKFVALVAKRSSSDAQPQLYVLATADDKLLQADSGNATFSMYDWAGDTLVYSVRRQDLPAWQQGSSKLKAYNADTGSTTLLDQTAGSDSTANINEFYSEVMVTAKNVIYGKIWQGSGDISAKQNSLQITGVDGQGHQVLANYDSSNGLYFSQHGPDTLYIWQHSDSADTFYQYLLTGGIKPISITSDQFYQDQDHYFFSASRSQTFWSEPRDGKQTLIVGDQDGNNPTTVASASDYDAYGWFGDQYLLLSKGGSELYIMNAKGGTPIKIANYLSSYQGY